MAPPDAPCLRSSPDAAVLLGHLRRRQVTSRSPDPTPVVPRHHRDSSVLQGRPRWSYIVRTSQRPGYLVRLSSFDVDLGVSCFSNARFKSQVISLVGEGGMHDLVRHYIFRCVRIQHPRCARPTRSRRSKIGELRWEIHDTPPITRVEGPVSEVIRALAPFGQPGASFRFVSFDRPPQYVCICDSDSTRSGAERHGSHLVASCDSGRK